ncbi:MAG: hypothetical protein ACM3JP_00535 [Betaproteobacteria bacterium]
MRTADRDDRRHSGRRYVLDGTLPRVSGMAALLVALLLLLGLVGLAASSPRLGLRNWLVVLFQVNSGLGSLPSEPLRLINPVDIAILVLVAVAFLGLWRGPGRPHRVWMGIAVALPLLGIPLLLVTHQAGRSAVLGGGIIVAVVMLTGGGTTSLGILGLLANVLLLIGDFATSDSRVPVAAAVGVGYVLLMVWFIAIGVHQLIGRRFSGDADHRRLAAGA